MPRPVLPSIACSERAMSGVMVVPALTSDSISFTTSRIAILHASLGDGHPLLSLASFPGDAIAVKVVGRRGVLLCLRRRLEIGLGDFLAQGSLDGLEEDVSAASFDSLGVGEKSAEKLVGSAGESWPVEDG